MNSSWFTQLKQAKKSCLIDGNFKKIHYDFNDGRELVEEYNLSTNVLSRRAWRNNKDLKGENTWQVEVGDPEPVCNPDDVLIKENSNQPFISRRITKANLEWRIRNLPYPIEIYSVTADEEKNALIVRTSNKKYYKVISVPDLERLNLRVHSENVTFSHKFNTLIITYKKPKEMLAFEKELIKELDQVQPRNCGDDIGNCQPS